MIKLFFYLPSLILNTWLAHLSPRWLFVKAYAPSTDGEREQELRVRNKLRLAAYHTKKYLQ
jgi:hypothetical protein